jgi:hypothetical protein
VFSIRSAVRYREAANRKGTFLYIPNLTIAVVGDENVLVSDNFFETLESNVPVSASNINLDDSDTDEESRPQDQRRHRPKPKHFDATAVKPQCADKGWQELAPHVTLQLENIIR